MMMKNTLAGIVAFMVLSLLYVFMQLLSTYPVNDVSIEVRKGQSFRKAVDTFAEAGVVKDPTLFLILGRIGGVEDSLIPGEYVFSGPVSQWQVYRKLKNGEILPSGVTIVEGDSLLNIRAKLAAEELVSVEDFDRLSTDAAFLNSVGIRAGSLEGYLFPDTYRFDKGDAPEAVFETMVSHLREMYGPDLQARAKELGWDLHRVLTLASIIEHEAVHDEERELVSAVYHNRLRKGMRLQADPTAIYGIKPLSEGVTGEDIRRDTPYNTYMITGLPPGPISSPGLKSIRAALYPADVPYLYFVANGTDGSHTFSSTHREHLRAVRQYRNTMNRNGG